MWGAPWLESPMSARLPLNAPLRVTAGGAGGGGQGRTDVRERMDGTDGRKYKLDQVSACDLTLARSVGLFTTHIKVSLILIF